MRLHRMCNAYRFKDKANLPSSMPLRQKFDSAYCADRMCPDCAYHTTSNEETTPEYIINTWLKVMELEPDGFK